MGTTRSGLPSWWLTVWLLLLPVPGLAQDDGVVAAAAAQALAEFEEACARVEPLWPADLCGPLVLVHPATRLAVSNRADGQGRFREQDGKFVGEWPANMAVANTAMAWEGTMWAVVMLPLSEDPFSRLQLLAHESFHRIQPELGFEVADPLATHLDEEEGRVWLRLELRAYARALESDEAKSRDATLDGLLFRRLRHASFSGSADIERRLEGHEGLAEYTGMRFALDAMAADWSVAAGKVKAFQRRPTYVRSLGYGTGPALGLLLDRYAPGWRQDIGPEPDLAGRLAAALTVDADGRRDREHAVRRAEAYGLDEVRSEESDRAARTAEQRARYRAELVDGPVLVLELPQRQLMFNPNTVLALGDAGNVYPGSILIGPWGRLTLQEGAALTTPDRDRAWVAAAGLDAAEPEGTVNGPGWILELESGWRLESGVRPGDFRLAPTQ